MENPDDVADALYAEIRALHPDFWFEVIQRVKLLALRDHFNITPMGLDPKMRKRLDKLRTDAVLGRPWPKGGGEK
jgi:hypothetical protein